MNKKIAGSDYVYCFGNSFDYNFRKQHARNNRQRAAHSCRNHFVNQQHNKSNVNLAIILE